MNCGPLSLMIRGLACEWRSKPRCTIVFHVAFGHRFADFPQSSGGQFGAFGPVLDVVDDLVAGVVGNPGPFQGSPSSFLSFT